MHYAVLQFFCITLFFSNDESLLINFSFLCDNFGLLMRYCDNSGTHRTTTTTIIIIITTTTTTTDYNNNNNSCNNNKELKK